MMPGSITTLFWMIKRYAAVPCIVLMDENKLKVKLIRHSFLYFVTHHEASQIKLKMRESILLPKLIKGFTW